MKLLDPDLEFPQKAPVLLVGVPDHINCLRIDGPPAGKMPVNPICQRNLEIGEQRPVKIFKCRPAAESASIPARWKALSRFPARGNDRLSNNFVLNRVDAATEFMVLRPGGDGPLAFNLVDKDCAGHPVGRIERSRKEAVALYRVDYNPTIGHIRLQRLFELTGVVILCALQLFNRFAL